MSPDEMRAQATRRKAEGASDMLLTLMRSREPRGETIKLPMGGPVGQIVGTFDSPDGRVRVAAFFACDDVLAWLDRHAAPKLEEQG
jgi:hypothetical protein